MYARERWLAREFVVERLGNEQTILSSGNITKMGWYSKSLRSALTCYSGSNVSQTYAATLVFIQQLCNTQQNQYPILLRGRGRVMTESPR